MKYSYSPYKKGDGGKKEAPDRARLGLASNVIACLINPRCAYKFPDGFHSLFPLNEGVKKEAPGDELRGPVEGL